MTENKIDKKEQEKKEKKIIQLLTSPSEELKIKGLNLTVSEGSERITPYLIDLLLDDVDEKIQIEAQKILYELKNQASAAVIMEAILKPKYKSIQSKLIAAFWQSGIDASSYVEELTEIAIKEDYMTGVEVLTCIENLPNTPKESAVAESITKLKFALSSAGDKKDLLYTLAKILQSHLMQDEN